MAVSLMVPRFQYTSVATIETPFNTHTHIYPQNLNVFYVICYLFLKSTNTVKKHKNTDQRFCLHLSPQINYESKITFSLESFSDLQNHQSLLPVCPSFSFFAILTQHVFFQIFELNDKDGKIKLTCLGNDLGNNQQPQYTVPPNVWFGSFPTNDFHISPDGAVSKVESRDAESHYSLVGCTCAPAFQFEDFELAKRSDLVSSFPNHAPLISLLTFPE